MWILYHTHYKIVCFTVDIDRMIHDHDAHHFISLSEILLTCATSLENASYRGLRPWFLNSLAQCTHQRSSVPSICLNLRKACWLPAGAMMRDGKKTHTHTQLKNSFLASHRFPAKGLASLYVVRDPSLHFLAAGSWYAHKQTGIKTCLLRWLAWWVPSQESIMML